MSGKYDSLGFYMKDKLLKFLNEDSHDQFLLHLICQATILSRVKLSTRMFYNINFIKILVKNHLCNCKHTKSFAMRFSKVKGGRKRCYSRYSPKQNMG